MQSTTFSFFEAIIFIMNMMIGSGLFLNTVALEKMAPNRSYNAYILIGIILIPLVIVCFRLLQKFPRSSFYDLGLKIDERIAFFMSWGYFFGKLATVSIAIVLASKLFAQALTIWCPIPCTLIALFFVVIITFLASRGIALGKRMPLIFFMAKIIPISLIIALAIKTGCTSQTVHSTTDIKTQGSLFYCIPLVIFSLAGFEGFFAIASLVRNAQRNASRVVAIGFSLVLALYCFYQYALHLACRYSLFSFQSFPEIVEFLTAAYPGAYTFCMLGLAFSALGAAYGVLYANMWNMNTLAQHRSFRGASFLALHNSPYKAPVRSALCAGCVVLIYIGFFMQTLPVLQQASALSTFITYVCCVYLYASLCRKEPEYSILIITALISCLILGVGIVYTAMQIGCGYGYMLYATIIILGWLLHYLK